MKLLQHTNCDCTLIQNYLTNEAQHYIRRLEITAVKGVTAGQGAIDQASPYDNLQIVEGSQLGWQT